MFSREDIPDFVQVLERCGKLRKLTIPFSKTWRKCAKLIVVLNTVLCLFILLFIMQNIIYQKDIALNNAFL